MSFYPNVNIEDLIILCELAEQGNKQWAKKFKNRLLKQTHAIEIAEKLSLMIKKIYEVIESFKKIGEVVKKSDVEDRNSQTPAIEIITGTQSLRNTLTLMKKCKSFYKLEEKSNGDLLWNGVFIRPLGENRIRKVKNEEYEITPKIQ